MLAIQRGGAGRLALGLWKRGKGAGGGIGKAARVVGDTEDRVVRDEGGIVRGVAHRAIGRMDNPALVEGGGGVVMIAPADSAFEPRIERIRVGDAGREGVV